METLKVLKITDLVPEDKLSTGAKREIEKIKEKKSIVNKENLF